MGKTSSTTSRVTANLDFFCQDSVGPATGHSGTLSKSFDVGPNDSVSAIQQKAQGPLFEEFAGLNCIHGPRAEKISLTVQAGGSRTIHKRVEVVALLLAAELSFEKYRQNMLVLLDNGFDKRHPPEEDNPCAQVSYQACQQSIVEVRGIREKLKALGRPGEVELRRLDQRIKDMEAGLGS